MAYRPPTASRFRDKIDVERKSSTSDGMGGTVTAWATVHESVSAAIFEAKGGEKVQADRLSSISALDIWVRAGTDVLASDRLRNTRTGEVYSVKWVGSLDQDTRYVLIAATKGEVSDG